MKYVRIFSGDAKGVEEASENLAKEKSLQPVNVIAYEADGSAHTCVVFEEML